jgi:hypothetical protein
MIQDGKLRGFAMGHAIPVRTDYTAGEVRRFAQRAKDAAQARRLLAIAAVLDGDAPLLALLRPQESNFGRHRAWGFARETREIMFERYRWFSIRHSGWSPRWRRGAQL